MMSLRAILILVCALACGGCADPRARAEAELKNGGAAQLRHDAALLYKEMFSGAGRPDFVEVWFKNWPKSFQKLRPIHVGAYHDGFTIALRTSNGGESGLYIVPESMDYEPKAAPGVAFQKLADGIFWFQFGQ
ncbi:MAG: hypothetical protein WCF18_19930 [Chthoniobacteraceae bacterium]